MSHTFSLEIDKNENLTLIPDESVISYKQSNLLNQLKVASSISTNILGVGILSIPYNIKQTGLILGPIILTFMAIHTQLSILMVERTMIITKLYSQESIGEQLFGNSMKTFIIMTFIFNAQGISAINLNLVTDNIQHILASNQTQIPYQKTRECWTLIIGFLMCSVVQQKTFRKIKLLGSVQVLAMVLFLSNLIILSIIKIREGSIELKYEMIQTKFELNTLAFLPSMILAWKFQYNWGSFRVEIKDLSIKSVSYTITYAIIIVQSIMTILIAASFVTFGPKIEPAVILNFYSLRNINDYNSDDPKNIIAYIGMVIYCIIGCCSFPFLFHNYRNYTAKLIEHVFTQFNNDQESIPVKSDKNQSIITSNKTFRFLISQSCLISIIFLAYFEKDIKFGFEIIGATASNLIVFIFPACLQIRAENHNTKLKLQSHLIFYFGLIILFFCTGLIIQERLGQ